MTKNMLINPHSYSIGTKVLLKDFKRKKTKGGKLLIRWKGPYTIVKLLGRGTYMLSDANSNTVRAIASHIKPFISDSKTENSVNQQHMRKSVKEKCNVFMDLLKKKLWCSISCT